MSERKFKPAKIWYLVGLLLAANFTVWVLIARSHPQSFARLHFFDVGQGDAVYVRTPQGNDVVIDGGPGDALVSKLGRVMPFADRTVELMILTHPHADHTSGLVDVLKRFRVKQVLLPEVDYKTATYQVFLDLIAKNHIPVLRPKLGQRIFLDQTLVLDILFPLAGQFDEPPKDINDASIVARLSLGSTNVLLTGDAGQGIEQFLMKLNLPLESEILKIGHHGSRHSTSREFLRTVKPDHSIISVGKNSYGHPHEEVLGLLSKQEREILRTDERGDINFQIYADNILLQSR